MTVLKSRAVSGNPPTAAQIKGPSIQEWGELGFLANIDAVAKSNNWDVAARGGIQRHKEHEGKYVAAPVNVHRVNWLWANPEVLRKAGATDADDLLDDFIAQAKKIQAAGFIALAHGGQAWQDATVFEAVVLGIGGNDYYQQSLCRPRHGCAVGTHEGSIPDARASRASPTRGRPGATGTSPRAW